MQYYQAAQSAILVKGYTRLARLCLEQGQPREALVYVKDAEAEAARLYLMLKPQSQPPV